MQDPARSAGFVAAIEAPCLAGCERAPILV
jgi:hypothetical protein